MRLRFSITHQLFAVILGLCLLMILAMGAATSWSVRTKFNTYNTKQDLIAAEAVTAFLTQFYRQEGSWTLIKNEPRLWRDILSMDNPERSQPSNPHAQSEQSNPEHSRSGQNWPREHWSLIDQYGKVIAGKANPTPDAVSFGIQSGGADVGKLMVSSVKRRLGPTEQVFFDQQRKWALLIMLLSAVLALLAALLLARRLVAPIHQLAAATHRLGTGQYSVKIADHRQDEFGQLARDFNGLAVILAQNEKLRRDFVADISHELRTPLAILAGEIEAMQDGIRPVTPAALASLQHETQSLTRLVDDLYQLALSDVGGLRYQMQRLDLVQLVQVAAQPFFERMTEHDLSLQLALPEQPIWVEADAARLHQLITNLLENSTRYTDAGGVVCLSLHQIERHAVLDCQDSTPSVSAQDLPRLFERLYRVEGSRNRATGGAGLGLPLCQGIVEAHHGSISAQASAQGGLWLHIELPLCTSLTTS